MRRTITCGGATNGRRGLAAGDLTKAGSRRRAMPLADEMDMRRLLSIERLSCDTLVVLKSKMPLPGVGRANDNTRAVPLQPSRFSYFACVLLTAHFLHQNSISTIKNSIIHALSLWLPNSRCASPFSAISLRTFSAVFMASTPAGTPQ